MDGSPNQLSRRQAREYIVYDSSSNWENLTTVLSIIYLGGKIINKSNAVLYRYQLTKLKFSKATH